MNKTIPTLSPSVQAHKQAGMTLIISMIMLALLTTISITVANLATTDVKIVANQQAATESREAAESGIEYLIARPDLLATYAPFSPKSSATETLPTGGLDVTGEGWSAKVTVQRLGDPVYCPPPSILESTHNINSTQTPKCVFFEIKSVGKANRGATKTVVRGIFRTIAIK